MTDLMTVKSVAAELGYSRPMIIYLNRLGLLPCQRLWGARIFTPDDVRLFRRRMKELKRTGKTLQEWRDVEVAAQAK